MSPYSLHKLRKQPESYLLEDKYEDLTRKDAPIFSSGVKLTQILNGRKDYDGDRGHAPHFTRLYNMISDIDGKFKVDILTDDEDFSDVDHNYRYLEIRRPRIDSQQF